MTAVSRLFCRDTSQKQEGGINLLTCSATGWEGIWSTTELVSLGQAQSEHRQAHELLEARREYATARRQAWHIYRTTEPGDPSRRGIGQFLS